MFLDQYFVRISHHPMHAVLSAQFSSSLIWSRASLRKIRSCDNSVSKVTGHGLWGPSSVLSTGYGALSPWIKRPGHEAEDSAPPSAEVKNVWTYTSTPPYVFTAWCLVKHRTNFTLTFGRRKWIGYCFRTCPGSWSEDFGPIRCDMTDLMKQDRVLIQVTNCLRATRQHPATSCSGPVAILIASTSGGRVGLHRVSLFATLMPEIQASICGPPPL